MLRRLGLAFACTITIAAVGCEVDPSGTLERGTGGTSGSGGLRGSGGSGSGGAGSGGFIGSGGTGSGGAGGKHGSGGSGSGGAGSGGTTGSGGFTGSGGAGSGGTTGSGGVGSGGAGSGGFTGSGGAGSGGTTGSGGSAQACSAVQPCTSGACMGTSFGCSGAWTCVQVFACSTVTTAYCGCDGVTFQDSSNCPVRPYSFRGSCEYGISCDVRMVSCFSLAPICQPGEVPSVVGNCYGSCVPLASCRCNTPQECPSNAKCVLGSHRCSS